MAMRFAAVFHSVEQQFVKNKSDGDGFFFGNKVVAPFFWNLDGERCLPKYFGIPCKSLGSVR